MHHLVYFQKTAFDVFHATVFNQMVEVFLIEIILDFYIINLMDQMPCFKCKKLD